MQETKRINKYLSEVGFCSRRQADKLVSENRVTINGKPAEMGAQVSSEDHIEVDGKSIENRQNDFVYIALNKPVGIECTTNTKVKDNVIDFIN